jgi:acyl-CoA thioester hydrolase
MHAPSAAAPQFVLTVGVTAAHIDVLGHMNHKHYVALAEDVAIAHWEAAAHPDDQHAYAWVASRIEIDFLRETLEGETLEVRTWVGTHRGARFDRHVSIVGADGVERARAVTVWACIDTARRRPARVPARVLERFGAPGAPVS